MGQVQLNAIKGREKWQIFLRPHSPLATEVQAQHSLGNQVDESELRKLWDYIADYASGDTKELSVETEDSNSSIPSAVLSKIESVVCIEARLQDRNVQFSGFIVDEEGLVVCTAHDLASPEKISVILYNGQQLTGHLVKVDPGRDLALVDVNSKLGISISLSDGRNLLGMGERIYSVGCPINLGGTVYSGIINGPPRKVNGLPLWQVNMQIHPGSSGSPVFDVQGNLVAIVKGRYRGTDSVGFLIPFETLVSFAQGY